MKTRMVAAALAAILMSGSAMASPFAGFYVGVDVGYGDGEANQERYSAVPGGPFVLTQGDADIDGFVVGGYAGHNWTIGPNWIFGLEGGLRYSGIEGDDGGSGGDINELSGNWEGALTAHVGWTWPSAMIYALGGYSWLNADGSVLNAPTESVSETFGGWTWGLGLDFTLGTMTTMRVQFRSTEYTDERVAYPVNGYDIETGPSVDEVSIGLAWHF